LLNVFKDLARAGITVVVVTHELVFAKEVADQVVFMDDGIVVEAGPPSDVIDHPQSPRLKDFLDSVL